MKTRAFFGALFAVLFAAASGLASAPTPSPGKTAGAPYDNPPAGASTVAIALDLTAARQILALLSRPQFDPEAAKALETLPAVRAAIQESKRPADVFEHDLSAAFDEKGRVTVFDFARIRENRGRWQDLITMIGAREAELTKLASDRARALLPTDIPVSVTQPIYITFGLAGRADHIIITEGGGPGWSVVADLARLLADEQSSPPEEQIKRLSRQMAGEAFQRAWAVYREKSPAWQKKDAALGALEPLLRNVARAGPVTIYSVDENFFPLAVWLKQPMKESVDDLNRVADRLVSTEGDLEARMAVAADIQKPDFVTRVAGPAGSFLADGIIQVLGLDAYRAALAGGPRAFFDAYERASQKKGSGLVPLGKAIRERLAAAAAAATVTPKA